MSGKKDGAVVVGVGAVACAACCAGPILGFLGAIGLGAIAGVLVSGAIGLLIAAIGVAALARRRRRQTACATVPGPGS